MSATKVASNPRTRASRSAADLGEGHDQHEAQSRSVLPDLAVRHLPLDDHEADANGALGHGQSEIQVPRAEGNLAVDHSSPDSHDIEHTRIAIGGSKDKQTGEPTSGRLRAMREDHGLGDTPEYATLKALWELLLVAEHQAELALRRALRHHPLGAWVKGTIGIGEKQGARLLAAVGDPAIKPAQDRDDGSTWEARPRRGVAEFWQYCGHGDPERSRRRKGLRVEFNPEAKMRVHLIAESCIKQAHSPYRAVYDAGRVKYAQAVHTEPCARCGPKGNPAALGTPLSDGHKHARALRLVGKAVLKDLFLASRHRTHDAQRCSARDEEDMAGPTPTPSRSGPPPTSTNGASRDAERERGT